MKESGEGRGNGAEGGMERRDGVREGERERGKE